MRASNAFGSLSSWYSSSERYESAYAELRKRGNPKHWMEWKADGEEIARSVEKYFLDKGMKGGGGGGDHPNWIYIF